MRLWFKFSSQMLEHLITGLLIIAGIVCVIAGFNMKRAKAETGSIVISTVSIFDPETGKEKIFKVNKFEVIEPNYTRFVTTDGKAVEIVENKVTVK